MSQTYISLRFDEIGRRFSEIQTLLELAEKHQHDDVIYTSLCRSAHILLVSHFEGIYKGVCQDVIDDINSKIKFRYVKKELFSTYCNYFIQNNDNPKSINDIKLKLREAMEMYPAQLKVEPFLFVDNKNPAPAILETILSKFGVDNFFWVIDGSELDLVFEDRKTDTNRLRRRLLTYTKRNVSKYPYTVSTHFYHPVVKIKKKAPKTQTLWEAFLNEFLKDRHGIVHGDTMDNPRSHEEINDAVIKIDILIMVFIINICSASNPLITLPE